MRCGTATTCRPSRVGKRDSLGGGSGEYEVCGNEGRYAEHLQVGYRTGEHCPQCGVIAEELRMGFTTSYGYSRYQD